MGVAHRDGHDGVGELHQRDGDLGKDGGLPHVHLHLSDAGGAGEEPEGTQAGVGVHLEAGAAGEPLVVHILAQAADAVAAHLSPRAIGVVHLHGKVPPPAGADADQAIRPHTKVAVGEPDRQPGGVGGTAGEAVEVDVVVSQPLHFGEAHAITPFRGAAGAPGLEDGYAPAGGNMPQLSLRPGRGSAGRSGPV